jgi:hypothetical protein
MNKHTCLWEDCESTSIYARGLCARDLKRAQRAGRLEEFAAPTRVCCYCEAEFRTQKNGKTKFCAFECQRLYVAAQRISQRIKDLGGRACKLCASPFGLSTRTDADFCSQQCQRGQWFIDNAEKTRAQVKAWRLDNPERVKDSKSKSAHLRRTRIANAPFEDFPASEIWVRDGGICWLCDSQIDPQLKWPHPQSLTLEHKLPISKGGGHTRENCALAHNLCNMRKGAKVLAASS